MQSLDSFFDQGSPEIILEDTLISLKDESLWEKALKTPTAYYLAYQQLTQSSIQSYRERKNLRVVHFLMCELATLKLLFGQYLESLEILDNLIESSLAKAWPLPLIRLYERRIECYRGLLRYKDMIFDTLQAWKLCINATEYNLAGLFVHQIIATARSNYIEPIEVEMEPFFCFKIEAVGQTDPSIPVTDRIDLNLDWPYGIALDIDQVSMLLVSDKKDVNFQAEHISIVSTSNNTVCLSCPVNFYQKTYYQNFRRYQAQEHSRLVKLCSASALSNSKKAT